MKNYFQIGLLISSILFSIKNNIKKYRNNKGFTQEKLSELAGVSTDYISEIERGKKVPSIKRLDKIAAALGIPAYKILMP